MFSSQNSQVSGGPPDAQFNYVTMLLHGDGTNGAQNNTFVDSSSNAFSITRNGNTTQGSFSPYGSGWSNYFGGAVGQYLNAPANTAFNFGTGDFTVEGWVYPTTTAGTRPIVEIRTSAPNSTGFALLSESGASTLNVYTNGGFVGASTNTFALNTWSHIALVRSGNTWTYWINGVSSGSFTNSSTQSDGATTGPKIGGSTTSGEIWSGYMSNIRIVKGTALYTTGFTPSTTPLTAISGTSLLTCQANRFSDASANAFTITVNGSPSVQRFNPFGSSTAYSTSVIGGSGYFDGSGDYLTAGVNTAFRFGTGDFCVEFWCYPFSLANAYQVIFDTRESGSGSGIAFGLNYGNVLAYTLLGSAGTVVKNQWNHIAVSRSGSTAYMFLNGVLVNSGTNAGDSAGGNSVIGMTNETGNYFNGYLAGLRVVKGSAVYTSAFTPPTAPPTAITNTSLLTNFTNGAIYDNAMMNDLETVGNAQISTSVVKYGTGSLAFDGTGDYLAGPYSPNLDFGTGDFTVELWFYFNGSVTGAGFIGSKNTGGMDFAFTSSSLRIGRINTAWDSTFSWSPSANTWYHIAFTRSNGTARAFVNGTQVGSDSSNTNNYYPNGGIYVGVSAPPDRYVNGYIDDLRITKGYARYTTTFTPPTKALSDTGPI